MSRPAGYSLFANRDSPLPDIRGTLTASQSSIETTQEAALPDLERRVLCVLCSDGAEREARETARRGLANYHWRLAVHQAVFDVIITFPSVSSRALRDQLPGRLTRRGFPDFDFEELFDLLKPEAGELEELIRKLRGPA